MAKSKILVIEDDDDILSLIRSTLSEGYELSTAKDGKIGYGLFQSDEFDLVILDVLVPGMNGLEICERIRQTNSDVRILMLTAMDHEMDKVRGFEMGADDYLTKPFSFWEFVSRVKALLRRGGKIAEKKNYEFGDVRINLTKREVRKNGKTLELTAKEFDLLTYMVQHPEEAMTRERLLEDIWV